MSIAIEDNVGLRPGSTLRMSEAEFEALTCEDERLMEWVAGESIDYNGIDVDPHALGIDSHGVDIDLGKSASGIDVADVAETDVKIAA
jgi:hypothetical protein